MSRYMATDISEPVDMSLVVMKAEAVRRTERESLYLRLFPDLEMEPTPGGV